MYYTAPVIENNVGPEQASDQFNEELHKMLDKTASQKSKICRQAKKNHGTTNTFISKKELSNTEEITTGESTSPKETGTTGY